MPMKIYELLYIIPTHYAETEIGEVEKRVSTIIEAVGAKVLKSENIGKLKLAYPINKVRHGTYILNYFEAEPENVTVIDSKLRFAEEVVRHLIVVAAKGAETKSHVIESFVAPLGEDGMPIKRVPGVPRHAVTGAGSATPPPVELVASPVSVPASAVETNMSMEELDKKLDAILDGDLSKDL